MITTFKSAINCSEEKVFPMYIYTQQEATG